MTVVNIDLRQPTQNGADAPLVDATEQFWTPSRRLKANDHLTLPLPVSVPLVGGVGEIHALATTVDWVWKVETRGKEITEEYVIVPADGPVRFGDLDRVDRNSLPPTAKPDPAWWAYIGQLNTDLGEQIVDASIVGGHLILEQKDGNTFDAGQVQGGAGAPGDKGDKGDKGDTGDAATVNDGNVSGAIGALTKAVLDLRYKRRLKSSTLVPLAPMPQYGSARVVCGTDGTKLWSFNSGGLYQVDNVLSGAWQAKALPANVVTTQQAKIVAPAAGQPGAGKMYLLAFNTVAAKFEIYSAPIAAAGVAPVWTGPLLQFATNGTVIPNAFRATSVGIFAGEYNGTPAIAGGPSVYRSTDGVAFASVLGPLPTTRHVHGIYEDPFNLGTIYVTLGDAGIPHWCYRSTDGGATFNPVVTHDDAAGTTWQSVSVGFTADFVVFIGDNSNGLGPFLMKRSDDSLRWATLATKFSLRAVPGGAGGRYIADLAINSNTTATSATAAFTAADVGRLIAGPNNVPDGTYIKSVTNATTVVLSKAATGTQVGLTALIGGDKFFDTAYEGIVDPATGAIFVCANDTSQAGTTGGVFMLPEPDAEWILLRPIYNAIGATNAIGSHELFLINGNLYVDRYGPIVVPALA